MKQSEKLQKIRAWANTVTDNLGKPIDEGIKDTVIALNALGIRTTGSCQGHNEYAQVGPWIHIKSPLAEKLEEPISKYRERTKYKKPLTPELLKVLNRVRLANIRYSVRVFDLLDRFYRGRKTIFRNKIIIDMLGNSVIRLQCQGWPLSSIQTNQERQIQLTAFQTEMSAFTRFLMKEIK